MPKGVLPPGLRGYQFQKKSGAAAPTVPKKSKAKAAPKKAAAKPKARAKAATLPKGLGKMPAGNGFLPRGLNTPNAQLSMGAPPFSGAGGTQAMPMGRGLGRQQMFIPGA